MFPKRAVHHHHSKLTNQRPTNHNQPTLQAVELAISSKNYDDAMGLALEHKVILTESMVEGMTMEKKTGVDEKALNAARNELLMKIASTCVRARVCACDVCSIVCVCLPCVCVCVCGVRTCVRACVLGGVTE